MSMDHGEYVGANKALKGKTALIQPHPSDPEQLMAQFDDMYTGLGHNWHAFHVKDFKILVPVRWDG